jgi:long-chain fatty acid transport protein
MNKNMKIMAVGLVSPMAYATNGDAMMSVGSQNTALGGTGVANFTGAESTFANPAMLGKSKGSEVVGGITLFQPKVTNTGFTGSNAATSKADTNYIPDISYSSRISDSLTWGIAMAGIAGMGVDYTEAGPGYVKARTAMSIAKVVPTIAYNDKDFGIGFSPVLQYGSLAISYDARPNGPNHNPDHNSDTNTGYGYTLGGYFNVMPSLVLAAEYQSAIDMTYGSQLSTAGAGFGQVFADHLEQPAEIKAGVAYTFAQNYTLTADYKSIQWSSAKGYKEFGWKDQTVVAVGAKYAGNGYWLGLGYNSADDPIGVFANGVPANSTNGQNGVGNFFNNMMFPAIVKDSYTLGGGFDMTKALSLELAAMFAPEVKKTVDVSDAIQQAPGTLSNTTTHSQSAYSVSLRYKF